MTLDLTAAGEKVLSGEGAATDAAPFKQDVHIGGANEVALDASVNANGAYQLLFGGTVPPHGYAIQNNTSAALWFCDTGAAATAGGSSFQLVPNGGAFITPVDYRPHGAVSVYGGTNGQPIAARYW